MNEPKLMCCFAILLASFLEVRCVSFEEDISISRQQKGLIDKLRKQVLPHIVEDYMRDDIYIIKWLRRVNFNMQEAEKLFIENIKWRKANGLATTERDDFSDVAKDYPYMQSGYDKEGRPVMVAFSGDWDIRGAVVTGRSDRVIKYVVKGIEMLVRHIRDLQAEGKNVTQIVLIIELSEFSLTKHACVQCIFKTLSFLTIYENHYPGMGDKIIFVNAPPAVSFIIEMIKNKASKETREAIQVYGTNKAQWQSKLLESISKENLPIDLGGTVDKAESLKF